MKKLQVCKDLMLPTAGSGNLGCEGGRGVRHGPSSSFPIPSLCLHFLKNSTRVRCSLLCLHRNGSGGPQTLLLSVFIAARVPHAWLIGLLLVAFHFFHIFLLSRYKYPRWEKSNLIPRAVSCKLNGLQSFVSLLVLLGLEGGDLGDWQEVETRWVYHPWSRAAVMHGIADTGWTCLSECGIPLVLRKVMAVSSR